MPLPPRQTIAAALALWALWALPALGQQAEISFAAVKTDPTAPVEVTADSLAIDQASGAATFSGHVIVRQSDMQLTAGRVEVIYAPDGQAIAELRATGGVTVTAGTSAVQAEAAVYVVATAVLTLTGGVLLTQAQATLAGQTMVLDLTTGLGRVEGGVTTTFIPGGN